MINDSTDRNTRDISYTNGSIWSYSNEYDYTPNIRNGIKMDKTPKTTLFENKITFSTEEKTKTEKGGN